MVDEYVPEGIPFLRSQNIKPFQIDLEGVKFISEDFNRRLKKSALRPGDLTVIRTGYPGTAAVVPDSLTEANCADLVVITPGPAADPFFLAALFNSTWGLSAVGGRLVGSAQQHFNVAAARSLEVLLPPLRTQSKIAAILSAYEDLIENNMRRIRLLEELAQCIYREWFVAFRYPGPDEGLIDSDIGQVPRGWQVFQASDALEVNPRISYDRASERPFVPMTSVSETTMHLDPLQKRATSSGPRFQNGDTLFARITPCLENGKTGYVQCLAPGEVAGGSTEFIVLRSRNLTPEYVYLLARSDPFRDHAIKSMSGATGRQRVRESCFDTYMIPVPPRDLLERFSTIVQPMFALSYVLLCEQQKLRAGRDFLLPRLVSGEVDVAGLNIEASDAA
jgi:type I restriction enzyme S subunit